MTMKVLLVIVDIIPSIIHKYFEETVLTKTYIKTLHFSETSVHEPFY